MSPLVRAGRPVDAPSVAALHAEQIGEGFLVTLGPRFLTRLYRRVVLSPHALLVVAESATRLVGFAAAATDTRRFYGDFMRRDALPAALAAAPACLRTPRRVWETFRYGTSDHGDLPTAEVLSIAVAADTAGQGVGSSLLAAAQEELARVGSLEARVVTAVGNEAALAMYHRAGFRQHARTEVHGGVPQEVLVWP
jgi:ribosomal protein S18 acetylase RimI-like enzyme